jgi:hypothetical protein
MVSDAPADPRIRTELEGCAICARRIIELRALEQSLSAAGHLELEVLSAAAGRIDAPGSARVEDTLRKAMSADPRTLESTDRRPRGRHIAFWLAAAGLLLTLVFVASTERGKSIRDPDESVLGTSRLQILEPGDEFDDSTRFAWRGELGPNEHFVVRVVDAATRDIVDQHSTMATEWTPGAGALRNWPRRIEWTVSIYVGVTQQCSTSPRSSSRRR